MAPQVPREPRESGESGDAGSPASLAAGRIPRASPAEVPRPAAVFDPVARALDRIGDRWTLVLIRHLLGGPKGFQELRVRTGIAPRVLSARLRQLVKRGWVAHVEDGAGGAPAAGRHAGRARSLYAVTERGRTLEPLVAAIARWWVEHAMEEHIADVGTFTETSAQSILESLPFLLREGPAQGADVTFEIRLSGPGGGVWTVRIADGTCSVTRGFAERADVRYTAETRVWCGVALGLLDARDAVKRGLLIKDGGRDALDHYFHQIPHPPSGALVRADEVPPAEPGRRERGGRARSSRSEPRTRRST